MNKISRQNSRARPKVGNERRNGNRDSSIPYAAKFVPADPPTIKPNLRRTIVIVGRGTTDTTTGVFPLDEVALRLSINAQLFGVTATTAPADYNYQVIKVLAWGGADDSTAITLTDESSGISSTDSGAYTLRPRVGIHYPPPSRIIRSSSSNSVIARVISKISEEIAIEYHVTIEIWTLSIPQI